jgi:hypothetical protein
MVDMVKAFDIKFPDLKREEPKGAKATLTTTATPTARTSVPFESLLFLKALEECSCFPPNFPT